MVTGANLLSRGEFSRNFDDTGPRAPWTTRDLGIPFGVGTEGISRPSSWVTKPANPEYGLV
jgi:hypothetical protein